MNKQEFEAELKGFWTWVSKTERPASSWWASLEEYASTEYHLAHKSEQADTPSESVMMLVKFKHTNQHDAWIGPDWMLVPKTQHGGIVTGDDMLRSYASSGRPYMKDFREVERIDLPEELRIYGRGQALLSKVTLYHDGRKLDGPQLLEAMSELAKTE